MRVQAAVVLALVVAGCAGGGKAVKHEPVYIGTQQPGTGIHVTCTKRLSYYRPVGHHLQVDRSQPVLLAPEGDIVVYLTPGPHELFIASLSSAKREDANLGGTEGYSESYFGYKSRLEFFVEPGEIKQIRYTPPLMSERSGKLEEVEAR